jgi:hypothetical protein
MCIYIRILAICLLLPQLGQPPARPNPHSPSTAPNEPHRSEGEQWKRSRFAFPLPPWTPTAPCHQPGPIHTHLVPCSHRFLTLYSQLPAASSQVGKPLFSSVRLVEIFTLFTAVHRGYTEGTVKVHSRYS